MVAAIARTVSSSSRSMLAEQAHAVQGDAGVVADGREQLEVLLAETAGTALAVDVERAEYLVGRPERHAHDRPDALADDALAAREPRVHAGVARERRHALHDRVGDERPAQRERALFGIAEAAPRRRRLRRSSCLRAAARARRDRRRSRREWFRGRASASACRSRAPASTSETR